MVVKRYPETLDRDEVGLTFSEFLGCLQMCPPDLSSNDIEELVRRWNHFLRVAAEFHDFEFGKMWFYSKDQSDAFIIAGNRFLLFSSTCNSLFIERLRGVINDINQGCYDGYPQDQGEP
jgi:hypothetical protein